MAWTFGGSFHNADNMLLAEDENAEELETKMKEYRQEVNKRRHWELGDAGLPTLTSDSGFVVPPEFLPKATRLIKGKKLYDFNHQGRTGGPVVSGRFKAAHDKIQPGGNQFVPVKILKKDHSDFGGEFYIFFVTTILDAINPCLGGFKSHGEGAGITYDKRGGSENVRHRLAVHKEQVAGYAAWHDLRFGSSYQFMSDAFVAELKATNADGFEINYPFYEI
jgi:hypothetical protein